MAVLIEGMEMSQNCAECFIGFCKQISCEHYIGFSDYASTRHPDCPLIEVPEPHGRLIDADAVERNLLKMQQAQTGPCSHGVRKSRAVLRDAQTVIPASEEVGA